MNQKDLAIAVGTTQRHISEIETGKARVSWTLMLAFSAIFALYSKMREEVVQEDYGLALEEEELVLDTMLEELKAAIG